MKYREGEDELPVGDREDSDVMAQTTDTALKSDYDIPPSPSERASLQPARPSGEMSMPLRVNLPALTHLVGRSARFRTRIMPTFRLLRRGVVNEAAHLAEDNADAVRDPWQQGASRYCDESGQQSVLHHILRSLVAL